MAGSTNFLQFDSDATNLQNDADYAAASETIGGVVVGLSSPTNFNKFAYQQSTMTAAIGQALANLGYTASDSNLSALISSISSAFGTPQGYLFGQELTYVDANNLTIGAGIARASDNSFDITIASPITINFAITGAGGRDTGSRTINSCYDIYSILNPTSGAVSGVAVLNNTSPALPSGYTKSRYLGSILNDASNSLVNSNFKGTGLIRECRFAQYISIISNTTPTPGAWVDLVLGAGLIPLQAHCREALIWAWFRSTGSGSSTPEFRIRTKGSGVSNPPFLVTIVGSGGDGDAILQDWITTDSAGKLEMQRDSGSTNQSATVLHAGYRMHL